jgi:hypothetical protein
MGYYSIELTQSFMQFDPSLDVESFQSAAAFEQAMDSSPNASPNDSLYTAANKLYLIFFSSVTNKLFLIQTEHLLTKFTSNQFKYKFENIFTNQQMLPPGLVKNFQIYDGKIIINGIRHLLYNTSICLNNEHSLSFNYDDEDFDDANSNQVR